MKPGAAVPLAVHECPLAALRKTTLLWSFLLLFPITAFPIQANAIVVSGQVVTGSAKQPVGDAVVGIYRKPPPPPHGRCEPVPPEESPVATAQTLTNGAFVVTVPTPGSYWIRAAAPKQPDDFAPFARQIQVAAQTAPVELALQPLPALHLKLADTGGKPATGDVQVWEWILRKDLKASYRSRTRRAGPDGTFSLPLPLGIDVQNVARALVQLRTPDGCVEVRTEGWPGEPRDVTLAPGLHISGRVLNAQGRPAGGVSVTANPLSAGNLPFDGVVQARSDAQGRFELTDLFPQTYLVGVATGKKESAYQVVRLLDQHDELVMDPRRRGPLWADWDLGLAWGEEFPASYEQVAERVDPDGWRLLPVFGGQFVDESTRKPVAGVFVVAPSGCDDSGDWVLSGPDGSFVLRAAAQGDAEMNANLQGYGSVQHTVHFGSPAAPLILAITRNPRARLRLLTANGGPVPAGKVHVTLRAQTNGYPSSFYDESEVSVAPDGTADVRWNAYERVPSGARLSVSVVYPGVGAGSAEANVSTEETLTIRLLPGCTLTGRVVDRAGNPRAGVDLELHRWDPDANSPGVVGPELGLGVTDTQGKFRFTELPLGALCVISWGPAQIEQRRAAVLLLQHDTQVVLAPFSPIRSWQRKGYSGWDVRNVEGLLLPTGGSVSSASDHPAPISGRVVGRGSGAPLDRSFVLLFSPTATAALASTSSGDGGRFTLDAPAPGPYDLMVVRDGYLAGSTRVSVPVNGLRGAVVTARTDPTLRLKLLDPLGKPLSHGLAEVRLVLQTDTARIDGMDLREPIGGQPIAVLHPLIGDPLDAVVDLELRVRVSGVGCARVRMDTWPDGPIPVRLQLGQTLRGCVLTAAGAPASNKAIKVTRLIPDAMGFADEEQVSVTTDQAGRFEVRSLLPAVYGVSAGEQHQTRFSGARAGLIGVKLPQEQDVVVRLPKDAPLVP